MTEPNAESNASAIASARARFSRANTQDERASAMLDELDAMLEDAWARAVANTLWPPAVLVAMVRAERLSFERLYECLRADPRWSAGVGAVIDSLTDRQCDALMAVASEPERAALASALVMNGRGRAEAVPYDSLASLGWPTLEVCVSPENLRAYARDALSWEDELIERGVGPEESVFSVTQRLDIACALGGSLRDELARSLARLEALLARDIGAGDDGDDAREGDLAIAVPSMVRGYVAVGDWWRARRALDRLDGVGGEGASFESVALAYASLLSALTPERAGELEVAIADALSGNALVRPWLFFARGFDAGSPRTREAFARTAQRLVDAIEREVTDSHAEELYALLEHPWTEPSSVERVVEVLARALSELGRTNAQWLRGLVLSAARRGSPAAQAFIERTSRQGTIAWAEDPSAFARLPLATLEAVLDGAIRAHPVRWPVVISDALRGFARDGLSRARVDRLVGRPLIEQQAQRAASAVGRMLERGARWLRDGGARDVESDRVSARIARGELVYASAFDRVWWELGETAQRAGYLARPEGASRAGWLPPPRVYETLGGAACLEAANERVDRWVARCAGAVGARG